MVRTLYGFLLRMHPPAFRQRFQEEMLAIFDEAARPAGGFALLLDGSASLARQWILRTGGWKIAAAFLGACLQVTAGGLIWVALRQGGQPRGAASAPDVLALDGLLRFLAASVGGVFVMVAAASLWMRSFVRRRAGDPRRGE
jgi:hypothetical protein